MRPDGFATTAGALLVVCGIASTARAQMDAWPDSAERSATSSLAQAGQATWQVSPYGDSPKRELSLNLSICGASDADGHCGGLTYTRNLTAGAALEGVADFGIVSRHEYDARLTRSRKVGPSHPFGIVIAQLRASRQRMPGLQEFMTIGVARLLADRDKLGAPKGRALSLGVGCRGAIAGNTALRLELQALLFDVGVGVRASAGVAIGFD